MLLIQARIPCSGKTMALAPVSKELSGPRNAQSGHNICARAGASACVAPQGSSQSRSISGPKKIFAARRAPLRFEALDPKFLASVEIDKQSSAPDAPKALPRASGLVLAISSNTRSFVTVVPKISQVSAAQGFPKFISVRNTLASSTVQVLSRSTSETVLYAFEQPTRQIGRRRAAEDRFLKPERATRHLRHPPMAGLVNCRLHT